MQNQKRVTIVCAALALAFGMNGCAWMSNTMSRAKERIVAMRERMKAQKPAEEVAAAAPTQVAAAASSAATGQGHHVIAGTGKAISNGAGECVNTGIDPAGAHGGGCDTASTVVATEPAPVVEATPMAEKPDTAAPWGGAAKPRP